MKKKGGGKEGGEAVRSKVHGEGGRWGRSTHELVLECQLAEVQIPK